MTTSYSRAALNLSSTERTQLEAALLNWSASTGIGRVVVPNVRDLEHFLPKRSMLALLRVVLTYAKLSWPSLEVAYQQECFKHSGRGGRVRLPAFVRLFGRAVERNYFENWLFLRHSARFPTRRDAAEFVRKLVRGGSPTPSEADLLMSDHCSWVTFSLDVHEVNPFGFFKTGLAEEVRGCLGLNPRLRGPLLLFVYELPSGVRPLRPTVADAELFLFFQPPPFGIKSHGLTVPWRSEYLKAKLLLLFQLAPRPEALHQPIRFKELCSTVRVLA